ncbi:DUF1684 domain-containing protein [Nocardioides sp. HM23]|uniref:DUF1684 domain-containing protein n=1 Tax=Nocardioides bizhenqiangii TaxID=3095076 RepID=UPI002ACA9C5B|nr:DUF1684 domain-containing protein [Nocardioides sp. HM23]MDZ5621424.1 DUF1684 domain-containing protein [Nocardioides sp. HM23]
MARCRQRRGRARSGRGPDDRRPRAPRAPGAARGRRSGDPRHRRGRGDRGGPARQRRPPPAARPGPRAACRVPADADLPALARLGRARDVPPLDGERPVDDAVGEVAFTLAGEPVRLVAYDDDGGLWLVFADATTGRTTYGAGRQLYTPAPAADGSLVLDFNRTINLPCAYTDYTTCPVPLPQNRLQVAIEAGEQTPAPSVASAQQ